VSGDPPNKPNNGLANLPLQILAHRRYEKTLTDIMHSLCEQRRPLNLKNHKEIQNKCIDLASLSEGIAADAVDLHDDPFFVEIANASRDQLFEKYGLFDLYFEKPSIRYEKIFWACLSINSVMMSKMIDREKEFGTPLITKLKQLLRRCKAFAQVMRYHIIAWMITRDAVSIDGDPVEDIMDLVDACDAYDYTIIPDGDNTTASFWKKMDDPATTVYDFPTVIESWIAAHFVAKDGHQSVSPHNENPE